MPCQEILQRDERALAVPKGHMLDVRHQRQLTTRHKLAETPCCADRRAAAAINVIVGATKNQGRYFHVSGTRQSVPGLARLVMVAVLLWTRLPLPQRIG